MGNYEDIERIKNNLKDVIKTSKVIEEQLNRIKNSIKETETTVEFGEVKGVYTDFMKLIPKDINEITKQYPISDYPDIYKISLAPEAMDIITDSNLFETVTIKRVSFK